MRVNPESWRADGTRVVDAPRAPRRFSLTNLVFAVFSAYLVWLAVTGRISVGHAAMLIGIWTAMLVGRAWIQRWWERPIDTTAPPLDAAPPHAPGDTKGESLAFPIALCTAIVGTLALLGFPGGGASTGIALLAVIAVGGWLALRRAIDGP